MLARALQAFYYVNPSKALSIIERVRSSHFSLADILSHVENIEFSARIITETITSAESRVIGSIPFFACEEEKFKLLCGHLSGETMAHMIEGLKREFLATSHSFQDLCAVGRACDEATMARLLDDILQERQEVVAALSPDTRAWLGLKEVDISAEIAQDPRTETITSWGEFGFERSGDFVAMAARLLQEAGLCGVCKHSCRVCRC